MRNAYNAKDGKTWDQLAARREFCLNDLGGTFLTYPNLKSWKEIQEYEEMLRDAGT